MSLDVTGRIIQKMDVVSGSSARGDWKKQEFVIETAEQYPKKICLSLWGDKVDSLNQFKEGDFIQASINIESREYNGRWYTDVRAWRLQAPANSQDGNNFAEAPQQFSENDGVDFSSSESDDLPF